MENEIFGSVYEKNSVIIEEGQVGNEMYIIQSGAVEVSRKSGDKDEVLVILGKGDFFGEMALADEAPRSASAVADDDDTKLLVLDKTKFTYMVQQSPEFSLTIMRRLAARLRRADTERLGGQHD